MNRLVILTLLGILAQSSIYAQIDCDSIRATQTDEYLRSIPNMPAYHWNDRWKIATIPLQHGDTAVIRTDGCEYHRIIISFTENLYQSKRTLQDFQHWLSQSMRYAKLVFPAELYADLQQTLDARDYRRVENEELIALTLHPPGGGSVQITARYLNRDRMSVELTYQKKRE